MTTRLLCLATLFTLLAPGAAAGQRLASHVIPLPKPTVVMGPLHVRIAASGILGRGDSDHRYAGFYVGLAVGLGIGVYWFGECKQEDGRFARAAPVAGASMLLCGAAGALLGALIHK